MRRKEYSYKNLKLWIMKWNYDDTWNEHCQHSEGSKYSRLIARGDFSEFEKRLKFPIHIVLPV